MDQSLRRPDDHAEIREEVAKLCARFPGEYWRRVDRERAYPTEFVQALTEEPRPIASTTKSASTCS